MMVIRHDDGNETEQRSENVIVMPWCTLAHTVYVALQKFLWVDDYVVPEGSPIQSFKMSFPTQWCLT